jgi:hypothetical protein
LADRSENRSGIDKPPAEGSKGDDDDEVDDDVDVDAVSADNVVCGVGSVLYDTLRRFFFFIFFSFFLLFFLLSWSAADCCSPLPLPLSSRGDDGVDDGGDDGDDDDDVT